MTLSKHDELISQVVVADHMRRVAEERAERLRAALVRIAESGCECMPVSWSDDGHADDAGICLAHQANDALFDDERRALRADDAR